MDWFRTYNGTSTDPKWLVIARTAGTIPGVVASLWGALMDHASQSTPRGSVQGFDAEVIAAFYGYELETVAAVIAAFRSRGMINEDEVLTAWAKRQPKREDGSAARAKAWREGKKGENAPEPTDPTPNGKRTHANATERTRTPEREREREERTTTTLTNVSGAASAPETVESLMPIVRERLRMGMASRGEQSRDLKHLRQLHGAGVSVATLRSAIENLVEMRDRGALLPDVRPLTMMGVRWLAYVPPGGGRANWQRAMEWDLETWLDQRRREQVKVA